VLWQVEPVFWQFAWQVSIPPPIVIEDFAPPVAAAVAPEAMLAGPRFAEAEPAAVEPAGPGEAKLVAPGAEPKAGPPIFAGFGRLLVATVLPLRAGGGVFRESSAIQKQPTLRIISAAQANMSFKRVSRG
jgi:hypothetical protein